MQIVCYTAYCIYQASYHNQTTFTPYTGTQAFDFSLLFLETPILLKMSKKKSQVQNITTTTTIASLLSPFNHPSIPAITYRFTTDPPIIPTPKTHPAGFSTSSNSHISHSHISHTLTILPHHTYHNAAMTLEGTLPLLNAFTYRHKNQHSASHWWSSQSLLRRRTRILCHLQQQLHLHLEAQESSSKKGLSSSRSKKAANLEKHIQSVAVYLQRHLIPKAHL